MKTVNIEGKVRPLPVKLPPTPAENRVWYPAPSMAARTTSASRFPSALRGIIYTPEFFKVNVKLGKEHETLIKDMQFHPVTDKPLHLDFFVLSSDKKVV